MGEDTSAEARIRELEAEVRVLHKMLSSAPDFITRITVGGDFLYLNRLAPGFSMDQVLGTSVDNYVPEQHREQAHAAIALATDTRTVQQYATMGQVAPNKIGHYLTRVSPVVEDDEVTSLVMIATDITELEDQRTLLQLALDASELGIWTYAPGGGGGTWDRRTREIFGVTENVPAPELQEMFTKYIHPEDHDRVSAALEQAQAGGRYGPASYRVLRQDGGLRWVNATGLATRDHDGNIVRLVGTIQDVTERRALEERLFEAQKLESIGRLAGGVAHDFNNMLTAVFGNLEFARDSEDLEEIRSLLDIVQVIAERSAALTAQLLAFARRQVIEPKVFDPNALVRRLDAVFQRTIGEHIEVVLALDAVGRVRADESRIEQVVLNLVTNARDAMLNGGVITVETLDVELDAEYASRHPDVTPGRFVLLAVSDTGPGIGADVLPHVFEPFYTTRSAGTGLGLATCYGIVKQIGGHLKVYSEEGRGATFKAYLPRVDEDLPLVEDEKVSLGAGRGEGILLVEDEAPVRSVVARTLTRAGYHVISCPTAEDALTHVEVDAARIELLITDVILPGMSGPDLATELTRRIPGLRVMFISGYTENAIVHGGVLDSGIHFLQKPFVPTDLLNAVRRVLDTPEE